MLLPRHVLPILGLCILPASLCSRNQRPTCRAATDLPPVTAAMPKLDVALPSSGLLWPFQMHLGRHGDRMTSGSGKQAPGCQDPPATYPYGQWSSRKEVRLALQIVCTLVRLTSSCIYSSKVRVLAGASSKILLQPIPLL